MVTVGLTCGLVSHDWHQPCRSGQQHRNAMERVILEPIWGARGRLREPFATQNPMVIPATHVE